MDYQQKYIKYKNKYLQLKQIVGGNGDGKKPDSEPKPGPAPGPVPTPPPPEPPLIPDKVKLNGIYEPTPELITSIKETLKKGQKPVEANFVLSAHGGQTRKSWEIPPNVNLFFFTAPGENLSCVRDLQSEVCRKEKTGIHKHSGPKIGVIRTSDNNMDYDYLLTPDTTEPTNPAYFISGIVHCTVKPIYRIKPWEKKEIWFSDLVIGIVEYCRLAGYPPEQEINITGLFCRGELPPPPINPYDPTIGAMIILWLIGGVPISSIIQNLEMMGIDKLAAKTVTSNTVTLYFLQLGQSPGMINSMLLAYGIEQSIITESIRISQETLSISGF